MNRVKGANLPVRPSVTIDRITADPIQAHLKRIVDDTERRLNILFDALNNETVPKDAVEKMGQIARGEFCRI